jgi:hypothetical protein
LSRTVLTMTTSMNRLSMNVIGVYIFRARGCEALARSPR